MKTGALYIRVSTEDQAELSPDAQKRLLLDYAKKNDIIVSKNFIFFPKVFLADTFKNDLSFSA